MKVFQLIYSTNFLLAAIALGIWAIFFQNIGIIPITQKVDDISSSNTYVDFPKSMEVSGSVSISNTVGIDIKKINGYSYFYNTDANPDMYNRLPVYIGN